MNKRFSSGKQSKIFFFQVIVILIISPILLVVMDGASIVVAKGINYIPASPDGPTQGFVNINYEYAIVTLNHNASWMFDWGDGTMSSWLQLDEGHTSLTQTHQWDSNGSYHVKVKFKNEKVPNGIWSVPLAVSIYAASSGNFPNVPMILCGTIQGLIDCSYTYSVSSADASTDQLSYSIDWGNGIASEWTSSAPTGGVCVLTHTWDKPGDYRVKVKARNQYYLESPWSIPVDVTIKNTTNTETGFIDFITLNQVQHHILFTSNHNGTFYNSTSGLSNAVLWTGGGEYLIDDENDGSWDYLFAPLLGEIQTISDQVPSPHSLFSDVPWMLLLIITSIIIGCISVIFVLVKTGVIYIYEEVVVEK